MSILKSLIREHLKAIYKYKHEAIENDEDLLNELHVVLSRLEMENENLKQQLVRLEAEVIEHRKCENVALKISNEIDFKIVADAIMQAKRDKR